LKTVGETPLEEPDRETQSPGPLRILLAEDNPVNQLVATRLLQRESHLVKVVASGAQAVKAFVESSYDVVLMDVQMPEMTGLEATARIRQLESEAGRGAHVPILAMTAHAMTGDRERCLESGMDGYIAKPIRREELFSALASAVPAMACH
jgi:CheY-like chemotaxis protein